MVEIISQQHNSGYTLKTVGLVSQGRKEISVDIHGTALRMEAEAFLRHTADYLTVAGRTINPGETMAYGYWLVKFQGTEMLETWEYNAEATDFIKGADRTLNYWQTQHSMCNKHGAEFKPPRPDKLTVISKGVLEGLPVQGVRYTSPDHMSGWWITTDEYDGDTKSLRNEHTYHVTAARPELAKFLALPEGFRFDLSVTEDVWFEEKIRKSQA